MSTFHYNRKSYPSKALGMILFYFYENNIVVIKNLHNYLDKLGGEYK